MNALAELNQMAWQQKQQEYPTLPKHALLKPKYNDRTANGLTRCIIDFLTLEGWQAERISTTGRMIGGRKTVTDVLGHQKTIGSTKWIKGSGQRGSADISATIRGLSVKIEIKVGRDRQSKAQREYQKQVEASGGVYLIVRDFEGFFNWYKEFVNELNATK